MRKNGLKKLMATLVVATTLMSQTAFAASGDSWCYSDHGTSTTYASVGGQTLNVDCTYYYVADDYDRTYSVTASNYGTGPTSISASAYKHHHICDPKMTVGEHRVSGSVENYSTTSHGYPN